MQPDGACRLKTVSSGHTDCDERKATVAAEGNFESVLAIAVDDGRWSGSVVIQLQGACEPGAKQRTSSLVGPGCPRASRLDAHGLRDSNFFKQLNKKGVAYRMDNSRRRAAQLRTSTAFVYGQSSRDAAGDCAPTAGTMRGTGRRHRKRPAGNCERMLVRVCTVRKRRVYAASNE